MLKRIITAVVCIAIFIPVLIYSDTWIFTAVLGLLALIAVFEVSGSIGVRRKYQFSLLSYLFVIGAFLFSAFYGEQTSRLLSLLLVIFYLYLFIMFALTMLTKGNTKFSQVAELVSMTLYILIGFLGILYLRRHEMGEYLYLLVFIGAWMTDTGAYFIGVLFGKHKLIPEVSPKKTIEGAFGGIFGCVIGFVAYGLILNNFYSVSVNILPLCCFAVVIAIVSQLGDLIASYIKREQGIKDYGFIFPGHGGVMDRFDSVLAVAPILLIAVCILPESFRLFT